MDRPDDGPLRDGRQSERALAIQRGACRLIRSFGLAPLTELPLSTGHRADIIALGPGGEIWIAEIKSSLEDFRVDQKWHFYMEHCDRLFFAVNAEFPVEVLPEEVGLIVADPFGAAILREAPEERLSAPRRRQVQLRFARAAALKLHGLADPGAGEPPR
jgi:hypothetical protein